MAKRSFIAHEMGKNDMIGILIVALVTIVVGVYNVWCSIDILSYLNSHEYQSELSIAEEMLAEDDYEDLYYPEDIEIAEELVAIYDFHSKLDPIDIVLYSGIVIMGILMMFRVRFSFLVSTILYILATITYIIYSVFWMMHSDFEGAADSLEGGIFIVLLRIAVLKMLIGMVISAYSSSSVSSQPVYVAPVGNVPLTPTERSNGSIHPVTGPRVASSMTGMLQKTPQQTHAPSMMQSVTPYATPQPAARQATSAAPTQTATADNSAEWQCKGCGYMNPARNDSCAFCGEKRN